MLRLDSRRLKVSVLAFAIFLVVSFILLNVAAMTPVRGPRAYFVLIQDLPAYNGIGDRADGHRSLPPDVARINVSREYVVFEDELYLKVQETRGALILTTLVKNFEWSQEKLEKLIADHPELRDYTK